MQSDPYFCISCNYKGAVRGIIQILTPCDNCGSLLIVPLASLHLLELGRLDIPALRASEAAYRQGRGRRHLKVVK